MPRLLSLRVLEPVQHNEIALAVQRRFSAAPKKLPKTLFEIFLDKIKFLTGD